MIMSANALVNAMISWYSDAPEGGRHAADLLVHAATVAWDCTEREANVRIGEQLEEINASRG